MVGTLTGEENVKLFSLFLPLTFQPKRRRRYNILLETAGRFRGTVSTSHVCDEAGLGRRRPKPPAGPPKFRYLRSTGLSGLNIGVLPSGENTDF